MDRIKDTVAKVIEGLMAKKPAAADKAPEEWLKKALTKTEQGHIKLNYFKKGVLGIYVDSSSWLYSLNLKKEGLLVRLKDICGEVKDIRFRLGEIK